MERFGLIPLYPTCHSNAGFKVKKSKDFSGNYNSQRKPAVSGEKKKKMNCWEATITVPPGKCQCCLYLTPVILEAFRDFLLEM